MMDVRPAFAVGTTNSVITPAVVTRPTRFEDGSRNQRFPSGPAVMSTGFDAGVSTGNSVTVPSTVIRPILLPEYSVNQSAPSAPAAIPVGDPLAGNSTRDPD